MTSANSLILLISWDYKVGKDVLQASLGNPCDIWFAAGNLTSRHPREKDYIVLDYKYVTKIVFCKYITFEQTR